MFFMIMYTCIAWRNASDFFLYLRIQRKQLKRARLRRVPLWYRREDRELANQFCTWLSRIMLSRQDLKTQRHFRQHRPAFTPQLSRPHSQSQTPYSIPPLTKRHLSLPSDHSSQARPSSTGKVWMRGPSLTSGSPSQRHSPVSPTSARRVNKWTRLCTTLDRT